MPTQSFTDAQQFTISAAPAALTVAFSGGPSGSIVDPQGGHLPDLYTTLTNTGDATGTYTIGVAIPTSTGGTTNFKWYAYAGQAGLTYNTDGSQVSVTLAGGASIQIRWGTTWSGNLGSYEDGVATVTWS